MFQVLIILIASFQCPGGASTADPCQDTLDTCMDYNERTCTDYESWARKNCLKRCGFCQSEFNRVEQTQAPTKVLGQNKQGPKDSGLFQENGCKTVTDQ